MVRVRVIHNSNNTVTGIVCTHRSSLYFLEVQIRATVAIAAHSRRAERMAFVDRLIMREEERWKGDRDDRVGCEIIIAVTTRMTVSTETVDEPSLHD